MHAWLRNTVMRLRFIKPRSQVAATEAGEEEKAKVRRAGLVERDDGAVLSHEELWWLFRQDNSSFSFLAQRVRFGFSSSLPDLAE